MPRDLADVLHHFIPEPDTGGSEAPSRSAQRSNLPAARNASGPAALPIVGVPVGDRDVVRAAFTWNLAAEVARTGARAVVVAPATDAASALWPEGSSGPLGVNVVLAPADDLAQLYRHALEVAEEPPAAGLEEGGLVFVRIPPLWLRSPGDAASRLRWILLFTSSENHDLLESYGIAKLLQRIAPSVRLGITVHGERRQGDAETAFSRLAGTAARRLGLSLSSYGRLVDDLHVYQAIVAQRPIGTVHPQSPAARSMGDVAQLLLADALQQVEPADG